ncbi:integral membrane sensor signal transduction histidine kinase [Nostoc linckia NIES-25]|nr:integral membrane sensor signal transduction histidine kinase [Nostoc linckia NIES-25]
MQVSPIQDGRGIDWLSVVVLPESDFMTQINANTRTTILLILQHRLTANTKHPEIEVIRDYANLPLVECYSGQLNQVFMNILINAIDAIEQIKAERTSQEIQHNCQITIRTSAINLDWVEIAIADNGSGMPVDVQQRIFEPFFTTKPVGKGTGMGLSISYQIIIDKHNGKLNCFSSLGEGTKFVIQIPVTQELNKKVETAIIARDW